MTTQLTPADTTPSNSTPDNWLPFADRLHRAFRRSPELSWAFTARTEQAAMSDDGGFETLDDMLDAVETFEAMGEPGTGSAQRATGADKRPKTAVAQILLRLAHALGNETRLQGLAAPGAISFFETGTFADPKTLQTVLRILFERADLPDKTTITPRIIAADGLSLTSDRMVDVLESDRPIILIAPRVALLPADLRRVSPYVVRLSPLTPAILRRHLEWHYGQSIPDKVELPLAADLRRTDLPSLQLALRAPDVAGAVRVLAQPAQQAGEDRRLADFPVSAPVRDALLQLVEDMRLWRASELAWDDVQKGLLLTGPPGTGKTEIARLLANEADLAVHAGSMAQWMSSGSRSSDVIREMRRFFDVAAEQAPALVFVDELDAIGSRGAANGVNSAWVDSNVAALLELLDGFATQPGVALVASTNQPEKIDPALRRPGRFDQLLHIGAPTPEMMPSVLRWHLGQDLPEAAIERLAIEALGASGAMIAAAVRSARAQARTARRALTERDVAEAIARDRPALTAHQRWQVSVHEAGHAVVSVVTGLGWPRRITISPDGGLTETKRTPGGGHLEDFEAELDSYMAGRAAERLLLGRVSCGAGGSCGSDLSAATQIAAALERSYGLGSAGPVWYGTPETVAAHLRTDSALRQQVQQRLQAAEARAIELLGEHRAVLKDVAEALCAKSVLAGADLDTRLAHLKLREPGGGNAVARPDHQQVSTNE
jgi:hypothetical protein